MQKQAAQVKQGEYIWRPTGLTLVADVTVSELTGLVVITKTSGDPIYLQPTTLVDVHEEN